MIQKLERQFVAKNLKVEWQEIEGYFQELKDRSFASIKDLKQWLKDRSELSAVLEEEFAWRYIRMNVDTQDENLQKAFQFFVQEINPKIAPYENQLNQKLYDSPFAAELKGDDFKILLRAVKSQIELFETKTSLYLLN